MLRITMSVSPEAAARYFDSALEKADYYAKSEAAGKGVWGGQGAGRLGLGNEVKRDDFIRLAANETPEGDSLTERTKEKRRAGYDFTFSVPKSVSLYLAETGDHGVEAIPAQQYLEVRLISRRQDYEKHRRQHYKSKRSGNQPRTPKQRGRQVAGGG